MLIDLNTDLTPIVFKVGPLTNQGFMQFNQAVSAQYALGAAPTFATTLRKAEFDFLERLKVNLKTLLHTDQEYQFISKFIEGDLLVVETKLGSSKQKRGMVFVTMESEVKVDNEVKLRSISSFVLRETEKGPS
jgi:hypothetical protein